MPTATQSDNSSITKTTDGLKWDEFLPIVEFDSDISHYEIDGEKLTLATDKNDKEEEVELSEYLDKKNRNPQIFLLETVKKKIKIPFTVKKGSSDSYDDDGLLSIKLSVEDAGIKLITKKEFKTKYDSTFNVEIEFTGNAKKEFYIDFYARDNEDDTWNTGELVNIHCGRMKVKPINAKSKIYFYSNSNGEFLGEVDSEFKNNRTILIDNRDYNFLKKKNIISLKLEKETLEEEKYKFDWNILNKGGLPSLGKLIHKYPTDINGDHRNNVTIDNLLYYNQCAIRLSYGLINSNFSLHSYPNKNKTNDGLARSSKGLADWLHNNVFIPKKFKKSSDFNPNQAHGIIFLWDKTGISHIDVVYYGQTGSGYYGADEIWYWELN